MGKFKLSMFARFSHFKQNKKNNTFADRFWATPSEGWCISNLEHQETGNYENTVPI